MRTSLESLTKAKDNFEKLSQNYIKKYEDLEVRYEQILLHNNELLEWNKKLELQAKYDGRMNSSNNGINLDGLMMSESNQNEEKVEKKAEDANEYKGYLKVSVNPTKLSNNNQSSRPGLSRAYNPSNKDVLFRDINMISSNILQKREQYSKVCY